MMWWWNDYSAPMHWVFGPLMMVVVIVLIFFMMRGMTEGQRSNNRLALDILKERLARGEISQAEYEERRRLIKA
jgi:putative membrane protein